MFVEQTHELETDLENADKAMRYTDTRVDEQERGISLKMMPMSLVMESSSSKSYLFNIIDTPGDQPHPSLSVIALSGNGV